MQINICSFAYNHKQVVLYQINSNGFKCVKRYLCIFIVYSVFYVFFPCLLFIKVSLHDTTQILGHGFLEVTYFYFKNQLLQVGHIAF